MTRSLVLAGGGMRVAWQSGVVKALEEDGITWDHVDGTSGGILGTAMLLSGLDADEMCRRWAALDVRSFGSLLPMADYLRGPWSLPAFGDADGIIHQVFPALGIDLPAIRSSPTGGSFNVVEFTAKRSIAFDAADVDAELLAAGLSLPLVTAPLRRDGAVYTDAVWVRDANVTEALRRGADEVWLVWCIGNTGYWGDGPLEQYVHMIEMSAMGALLADFEVAAAAGRTFVLHVVKPEHPLPLDPELYLGRISNESLVAMGYRDARRYLAARDPGGVPADETSTRMTERAPSIRWTEHLTGEVDGAAFRLAVTVVMPVPEEGGERDRERVEVRGEVSGWVEHDPWGPRVFLAAGECVGSGDALQYRGEVRVGGRRLSLSASRSFHDDPGLDAWSDLDDVRLVVRPVDPGTAPAIETTLRLGLRGARRTLASVEPVGVHGPLDRARTLRSFLGRGLARLHA